MQRPGFVDSAIFVTVTAVGVVTALIFIGVQLPTYFGGTSSTSTTATSDTLNPTPESSTTLGEQTTAPPVDTSAGDATAPTSNSARPQSAEQTASSSETPSPDQSTSCIWATLAAELQPGHRSQQTCPSGAVLTIETTSGYGNDPADGAGPDDRNKASAASADDGIAIEIRNPLSPEPLVVSPSSQPGCFGQYIESAGIDDVYSMIDTAELVIFRDDLIMKTLTVYEDCTSLDGTGTGDSLTITYAP